MPVRILGNKVYIESEERKQEYAAGIIMPEKYQRKPISGTVAQLGDTVGKECPINVGDKAIFHRYCGSTVEYEDKEFRIVEPDMVFAVIRDNVLMVLGDRVLLTDVEKEEKKVGSIIIPAQQDKRDNLAFGDVVSVGAKCSIDAKKGDRVMFDKTNGYIVEVENVKYRVIESDALYLAMGE